MKLTGDEHRALAFIAALLFLSAGVRVVGLPEPVTVAEGGGLDLAEHIAAVERAMAEEETMQRPLAPGERIDPNTAPEAELARLPGVGPALSRRIVADREANGPYSALSDLGRVAGVGERTLERLAPHLALRAVPLGARSTLRRPDGDGGTDRAPRVRGASSGSATDGRRGDRGNALAGSGAYSGSEGVLDLNRATAQELTELRGIGPVLAERIVAYRDSAGPFRAVSDLVAVKGIGPATLARIGTRLSVR